MQRKTHTKHLMAVLAGLALMTTLPVMAAEQNTMPVNPKYSENGAAWDEKGLFVGSTRDKTDWSYVYFGSYPQTEVMDAGVKSQIDVALNAEGKTTGDITVGNVKYRKISPENANTTVYWEKNENGDVIEQCRYFKWEPIRWKVLQIDNNSKTMMLVSDKVIDSQDYNEVITDVTWESCTMRKWLNADPAFSDLDRKGFTAKSFLETAFSTEQQGAIIQTDIKNHDNQTYKTSGGNDTKDKVFLLSHEEVADKAFGFNDTLYKNSTSRAFLATDYANAMGAWRSEENEWYKGCAWWWLRTPGETSEQATKCVMTGWASSDGDFVFINNDGVAPALYLNQDSLLWSVNEDGSRPDGNETDTTGTESEGKTAAAPAKVKIASVKNNKKGTIAIQIKTKKTDPKVEGYEVVSSTSQKKLSKVKKAQTFTKTTIKLKKLKKGKTYYFKIRAFNRDAEGKKVYGKWSKVRKVKIKK